MIIVAIYNTVHVQGSFPDYQSLAALDGELLRGGGAMHHDGHLVLESLLLRADLQEPQSTIKMILAFY